MRLRSLPKLLRFVRACCFDVRKSGFQFFVSVAKGLSRACRPSPTPMVQPQTATDSILDLRSEIMGDAVTERLPGRILHSRGNRQ